MQTAFSCPTLRNDTNVVGTACMDALRAVEPVCCPVCNAVTSGGAINHAMAEVAEMAWVKDMVEPTDVNVIMDRHDRCGVALESDSARTALVNQLVPLLDHLTVASVALETGSLNLAGAKADLIAHVEGSIARFDALMDDVIVRVNEYRAISVATAREVCANRLKVLDAQEDVLTVSVGQLAACVSAGKGVIARGNYVSVKHALDNAAAMLKLEKTEVMPQVPLQLDIAIDMGPWLGALADLARLRLYEVDAGLAITSDAVHMVVSSDKSNEVSVYQISDGSFIRSFGIRGSAPGCLESPLGLCTTDNNTILIAEHGNQRIQELTLEGWHVRFIGNGVISQGVCGVAIYGDVIAVGGYSGFAPNRIMLFSYTSGALLSKFGAYGEGAGQYMHITSIKFTADGKHLVVADYGNRRVILTSVEGVFVRNIGIGELDSGQFDVSLSSAGDIIVTDTHNNRVCVFSHATGTLLRTWGTYGHGEGHFIQPLALATCRKRMYVLDRNCARVQAFE